MLNVFGYIEVKANSRFVIFLWFLKEFSALFSAPLSFSRCHTEVISVVKCFKSAVHVLKHCRCYLTHSEAVRVTNYWVVPDALQIFKEWFTSISAQTPGFGITCLHIIVILHPKL